MKQKTIKKEISFSGIGVHTGKEVNVILRPREINSGITFSRKDKENRGLSLFSSELEIETHRGTNLLYNDIKIMTVEHFLSAVYMMGIANLEVVMDGDELPAGYGNAEYFKKIIDEAGIIEQNKDVEIKNIDREIKITDKDKSIIISPSNKYEIIYTIDYPDTPIGKTTSSFEITEEIFFNEIAPARTFCLEEEINMLYEKGLAKGGTLDNALVVKKNGYSSPLKYSDEPLRHKVLDIVGDLATTGQYFCAKIEAVKSGHELNIKLAKELRRLFYD